LVEPPDGYHPTSLTRREWEVDLHPQLVAENSVDCGHFAFVHRAAQPPVIVDIQQRGPNLHVSQEIVFGASKPATWLTPDGPVKGALEIDLWGLGLAQTRFAGADESYSLVATTPIADGKATFRMTNWVVRAPEEDELGPLARRRVEEQFKQAQRDFVIWEHLRYVERPPLSRTEARSFRAFRTWAEQFYSAGRDAPATPVSVR
jgi:hypothetical protein